MSRSNKSDSSLIAKDQVPKQPHFNPMPMAYQVSSSARARTTSTDSTPKNNDDETILFETITMAKFEKFQAEIFPIVSRITTLKQYQDHAFAALWKQALTHPGNPLNKDSTLRSIHKILPVENLQDYRRFILECPTIETYVTFKDSAKHTAGFEVYFNDDKIKQLMRSDDKHGTKDDGTTLTSFDMLADGTTDPSRSDTITTDEQDNYQECFGNRTDFKGLWTQICFILNTFAVESPDDVTTKKWKEWQRTGLTIRSDLQEVKRITNLGSLSELFCFLRDCPPVTTFLDIKWDNKILYRPRQEPTYQHFPTPDEPTNSPDAADTQADEPAHFISPVKKQPEVDHGVTDEGRPNRTTNDVPTTPFPDMFHDADELDPSDMIDYYTVDENKIFTADEFRVFHCYVTDIIDKWISQDNNTRHPFHNKWRRWTYHGMSRTKDFTFIRRLLGIEDLSGYLAIIKECPAINKHIGWLWYQDELRYWIVPQDNIKENEVIENNQVRLHNLQVEFNLFQNKFDLSIKDINNKLVDMHYRLDNYNVQNKRIGKSLQGNIYQIIESGKTSFQQTMEAQKDIFQRKLTHLMDSNADDFLTNIRNICKSNTIDTPPDIEGAADRATERILKEIYKAADETTDGFNKQVESATSKFLQQVTTATDNIQSLLQQTNTCTAATTSTPAAPTDPSAQRNETRWKHVTQATKEHLAQFVATTPDFGAPPPFTEPTADTMYDNINGNIENPTGAYQLTGGDGLPWLQFDQLLKRTKVVQYNGQSDIFVFYNQLYNITNNYGLYMRKLQTLKLGMSICPDSYNGINISDTRRAQMANCMYQILQNPEVIPTDFVWARNIINRFSEANDEYKVLYAMVKPILNKEIMITAPSSLDCSSIHDYSQKFNSYINCEQLAGRLYNPREQVTKFLAGLDSSYAYAIERCEQLMDTGSQTTATIPESLGPEQLPDTVDRYHKQAAGQMTIRAMTGGRGNDRKQDNANRYNTKGKSFTKPTNQVEKPCGICHAWGHLKSQCGGFARILIFQETSQNLEETYKSKIIKNYKAEMKLKAEAKLKSQRLGTVRQMWEQGCAFEDVEENLVHAMMQDADTTFTTLSDDDSAE